MLLPKAGHKKYGEICHRVTGTKNEETSSIEKSAASYLFIPWETAISPLQEKWLQASLYSPDKRKSRLSESVRKDKSGQVGRDYWDQGSGTMSCTRKYAETLKLKGREKVCGFFLLPKVCFKLSLQELNEIQRYPQFHKSAYFTRLHAL